MKIRIPGNRSKVELPYSVSQILRHIKCPNANRVTRMKGGKRHGSERPRKNRAHRHCADSLALWQYGLWSFQTGDTKLKRLFQEIQHTQRKLLNFENWCSGELGIILVIKWFKNWCYKKMSITKNLVLLNWILQWKKKWERFR